MDQLSSLNIEDTLLYEQVNLEKYTTIKLHATGNVLIVKTTDALSKVLKKIDSENLKFHIIGWGSNQVLTGMIDIYIKLDFTRDTTELSSFKDKYELTATTSLLSMTTAAKKFGLKGWEVLTGIPASLGGAICMNAGTSLGEIAPLIESVKVMNLKGEITSLKLSEKDFSYRKNHFLKEDEVIVSAVIKHFGQDKTLEDKIKKYLSYRMETQPLKTKNCGSVFKNNGSFRAGIMIDRCGLKGYGAGNLHVSYKHANFIEHQGSASADEFIELTDGLINELERFSGQKFVLEVKIV